MSDTQQASKYLLQYWRRRTKDQAATPPIDLMRDVTKTVMTVGYTRKVVEEMTDGYIRNRAGKGTA